jgi:hypothetical protein
MTICHYRLVRNHLGSDRKECLQRNLPRDILYKKKKKKKKKERKKERKKSHEVFALAKDVGGSSSILEFDGINSNTALKASNNTGNSLCMR